MINKYGYLLTEMYWFFDGETEIDVYDFCKFYEQRVMTLEEKETLRTKNIVSEYDIESYLHSEIDTIVYKWLREDVYELIESFNEALQSYL